MRRLLDPHRPEPLRARSREGHRSEIFDADGSGTVSAPELALYLHGLVEKATISHGAQGRDEHCRCRCIWPLFRCIWASGRPYPLCFLPPSFSLGVFLRLSLSLQTLPYVIDKHRRRRRPWSRRQSTTRSTTTAPKNRDAEFVKVGQDTLFDLILNICCKKLQKLGLQKLPLYG